MLETWQANIFLSNHGNSLSKHRKNLHSIISENDCIKVCPKHVPTILAPSSDTLGTLRLCKIHVLKAHFYAAHVAPSQGILLPLDKGDVERTIRPYN